jgi:hypothetical protein
MHFLRLEKGLGRHGPGMPYGGPQPAYNIRAGAENFSDNNEMGGMKKSAASGLGAKPGRQDG